LYKLFFVVSVFAKAIHYLLKTLKSDKCIVVNYTLTMKVKQLIYTLRVVDK